MTGRISIVEVSPRDGLQNEPEILPTQTKVELIERLIARGAQRIEATSFVSLRRVPQMADAEAVMKAVPRRGDVSYIGLVLNRHGFERAVGAGCDEINFVISSTDTFNRRNQGVESAESVAAWSQIAAAAHKTGINTTVTIACAFGCPFEGEVSVERVCDIVARAAALQSDEIALADTIGVGVPTQVRALLSAVRDIAPDTPLRCHFHNTRNTGFANVAAAVEEGAHALDSSLGGIGGCPFAPAATGNIPTEDLVYMLDKMGVETGVDGRGLCADAAWLGDKLGKPLPGLLHRAGYFPE